MSYRMGEVCQQTGLSPRQLREWERRGLVHPGRGVGSQRSYTDDDLTRLRLAKRLREAGLGLAEVRLVMDVVAGRRLGGELEALTQIHAALGRMRAQLILVEELAAAIRRAIAGRGRGP